jgi:hypothetical protein
MNYLLGVCNSVSYYINELQHCYIFFKAWLNSKQLHNHPTSTKHTQTHTHSQTNTHQHTGTQTPTHRLNTQAPVCIHIILPTHCNKNGLCTMLDSLPCECHSSVSGVRINLAIDLTPGLMFEAV